MKIRDHCLDYRHAFTQDALTWTFNIDLVDPVTEFKVWFYVKNNTKGVTTHWYWPYPLPYYIKRIEVIDGSEVIASMRGHQAISVSCFDMGYAPLHWHQELPGMSQYWCFPIHFGRSLVDPEWIFDPKKFRNPQLRITWNLGDPIPVGAGGFLSESVMMTWWAKVMEEGARPRGYLMTKEVKAYTPAGPGDLITYLPTDFPHRKLFVRSYYFNGDMGNGITHIKVSQDQDKWIPVDLNSHDFIFLMKDWFTEVQFHGKHYVEQDCLREHFGGMYAHGLLCSGQDSAIVSAHNWAGNCFEVGAEDDAGTEYDHDNRIEAWSMGMTRTPFDTFCLPFGDQEDAADWLNVGAMGNLRLILTHAANPAAGNYHQTEIVCQQAHPY